MTLKIINPFTDIDYLPPEMKTSPTAYQSAKTLQIGYGADVLRANRQGLWLGRNTFEEARDAPTFAVSMDGTMYIKQLQASDVIISGSTTLADWRHSSDLTRINGGDIYTNSVTATQIYVVNLSSLSANLGTVTAGTYQTAGTLTRIKIEDDDILWQRLSGSWQNCGVLRGANVSYYQYNDGSQQGISASGIEHYSATGTAFFSNDFSCNRIWVSTKLSALLINSKQINAIKSTGAYQRLYAPVAGSNISVSNNGTTQQATIALSINAAINMNSYDITGIDDCKAVKFWGNGSGGITGSHSWVNAEGDTIDLQIVGGIVTNFTVTP